MVEIRCPMCGKPNPVELEICQFCQARLKPVLSQPVDDPADKADIPDWLRSLNPGNPDSSASQPDDNQGLRKQDDWLQGLRDADTGTDDVEDGDDAAGEVDWFEADGSDDGTLLPDWLSGNGKAAEQPDQAEPYADHDQPEPEVEPEWLRRIRALKNEDEGASDAGDDEIAPPSDTHAEGYSVPWEKGAAAPFLDEDKPFIPQDAEAAFSDLHQEPDTSTDYAGSPEKPWQDEGDLWKDTGRVSPFVDEDINTEAGELELNHEDERQPDDRAGGTEAPFILDDLPDWLDELVPDHEAGPFTAQGGTQNAEQAGEPESPQWSLPFEEAELAHDGDVVREDEEALKKVLPFTPDTDENLDSVLFTEELPDWLANVSPAAGLTENQNERPGEAEAFPKVPAFINEEDDGLAKADLPDWLAAIQPSAHHEQGFGHDEAGSDVESVGPLGGLRGVIPAEPDITQVRKPGTYSLKLQVSEEQQRNAELFAELVKKEGEPRAVPQRPVLSSQHVLRVLLFVILIVVIVLATILDVPAAGTKPVENNPDVLTAFQVMAGLNRNDPVLVAFDYEPGYAAEMDVLAENALEQLMTRGVYLTLVSTSPVGPVQAERVLEQVNRTQNTSYRPGEEYVNLGYLPAGQTGLQAFSRRPQQIFPYIFLQSSAGGSAPLTAGRSPWEMPPLQAVDSLDDFALVIVLTEDPDKARTWIEQVQPALQDTPFMLMTSNQAEPMVRPYYEASSGQVDALISGMNGAVSFEVMNQKDGTAISRWNAYAYGLLVAILLILLGGAVDAGMAYLDRRKASAEMGKVK